MSGGSRAMKSAVYRSLQPTTVDEWTLPDGGFEPPTPRTGGARYNHLTTSVDKLSRRI